MEKIQSISLNSDIDYQQQNMKRLLRNIGFSFVYVFLYGDNTQQVYSATTLIEFDSPYLIATKSNGIIHGYCGLSLPEVSYIRPAFSCNFFIRSEEIDPKRPFTKILTFYTKNTYLNREKDSDLPGELIIRGNEWIIQMDNVQGGCLSAAGGGFLKGSTARYTVIREMPIIGIRTIKKKTSFYDLKGKSFSKRKGFLVRGDVVIALDMKEDFYLIKFLNTETDEASSGWIKKSDTSNPFPEMDLKQHENNGN